MSNPSAQANPGAYSTCDLCGTAVHVGTGGKYNLQAHQSSSKCKNAQTQQKRKVHDDARRKKFANFFVSKPSVSSPPKITAPQPARIDSNRLITSNPDTDQPTTDSNSAANARTRNSECVESLCRLLDHIRQLPLSVLEADERHPFSQFAGSLDGLVPPGEDAWEIWDGRLNTVLQKEAVELEKLVARGELGLIAFHRFLSYLVDNHQVQSALFENKVERVIRAVQRVLATHANATPTSNNAAFSASPHLRDQHLPSGSNSDMAIISDDEIEIIKPPAQPTPSQAPSTVAVHTVGISKQCPGLRIDLPSNKSPHTAYPFALHERFGDPWDYAVEKGRLTLRARDCHRSKKSESSCAACASLAKNPKLTGILERIENGVDQNCPFEYHGSGGMVTLLQDKTKQVRVLKLCRVNDARKLTRKLEAIDDYKEWIMAVGSGKVQRVDRLAMVALNNKRGIRGMLDMYERAACKVYKPRTYTEEDQLKAIFLWRTGGARVAEMAHRSLDLPSLRTSRRNSALPRLVASACYPMVDEVEANLAACFGPISSLVESDSEIVHQGLMLDELKNEPRPRWDDWTNLILGFCREHTGSTSLEYTSNLEVDLLLEKVEEGSVHLATNATVGAIGIYSEHHRVYGALPVLISGQCGRETGAEHAQLIQTALEGAKKTNLRTVCIASDGESRRGEALVRLTMKHNLSPSSSIYPQLGHLRFMNLEVGDDDITADKDAKHVFKRLRNLCLRNRGIRLHDVEILPSNLRSHFANNRIPERHVGTILNPDDKQDVKLAYDLLSEVWRLPSVVDPERPGFSDTRCALQTLGEFFKHLLLPYICIDLSLAEQLIHLSAAAHMLLAMAREDGLPSLALLMPSQLYLDIMIMVKNHL